MKPQHTDEDIAEVDRQILSNLTTFGPVLGFCGRAR